MSSRFLARRGNAAFRVARIGALTAIAAATSLLMPAASAAQQRVTPGSADVGASVVMDANMRHANSAFGHFMVAYWNASTRTFYSQSDHEPRPGAKATAPMWWVAQAWEIVMDDYQRTRTPWDRQLIDDVYDGWITSHGGFSSNYNDDRGWWALGATRAYELTGESRFRTTAVQLADDQWRYWDSTFGGGLWWRRSVHDQKNVATNAPAAMTNATLYQLTGRARFKTRAMALFAWVDGNLRSGGRLDDRWAIPSKRVVVDYTYNYGTYIGAALDLYQITGNHDYLDSATSLADSAMSRLASNGVLRDEGTGDAGGFKGIFVRNLQSLAAMPPSAIPSRSAQTYASFLSRNAGVAWHYRTAIRLWSSNWAAHPPAGPIQVLTDMSAVSLFEAQALTSP
jgi:predicted alpha-1,6-mannanase (GH76 family)